MVKNISDLVEDFEHNLRGPTHVFIYFFDDLCLDLASAFASLSQLHAARLAFASLSSLRHAYILSKGGAAGAVPAVLRHSIEASLYALLLHNDPIWSEVWEQRETKPKAKQKFRNEGLRSAKEKLEKLDPFCKKRMLELYEHLITFGAHPNVFQIEMMTNDLSLNNEDIRFSFETLCNSERRDQSLIQCGQAYEVVICLFGTLTEAAIDKEVFKSKKLAAVKPFYDFMDYCLMKYK